MQRALPRLGVYQQFEALCLEVEEIMYQDTVKYVENQVQTVGASVKNLYTDVMQEFLPPTSTESDKVAAWDLPFEQYSEVVICKKPNMGLNTGHQRVTVKKSIEDSVVLENKQESVLLSLPGVQKLKCISKSLSWDSLKGASADTNTRQQCAGSVPNDSPHQFFNHSPENEILAQADTLSSTATIGKTVERTPLDTIRAQHCDASCGQAEIASSYGGSRSGSVMVCCEGIEIEKKDTPDISIVDEGKERLSSCADKCTEFNDASAFHGEFSMVASSIYEDYDDHFHEKVIVSTPGRTGDCNLGSIERDKIIEQEAESGEQFDVVTLEETCVVVNGEELPSVSHQKPKRRTCKKKIREVFSSRRKSVRKQEYEQLALCCGDDPKPVRQCEHNLTPILGKNKEKSQTPDGHENDWELL